ncbi:MAG: nitroreductase family protein [Candidatus Bathyarchaeota archaeon]|nr:nitroreductase family protein [Candidatus Bathyarchaeota archaeon]
MPNTTDAIRKRRSIRKFSPRPVPRKLVLEVLEVAGWAPSAHNVQPWRFIILEDLKARRELAEAMANARATDLAKDGIKISEVDYKASTQRFADAPVLILACLSMEDMKKFADPTRQGFERDLAVQSLGAAVQSLFLAAYQKGLGGCWYCAPIFCKDTVRQALKIPENVEPAALITLGYRADEPPVPSRKPVEKYCFLDCWGEKLR